MTNLYSKDDDKLLYFFVLLSYIWDAKYSKNSLLFFLLILVAAFS